MRELRALPLPGFSQGVLRAMWFRSKQPSAPRDSCAVGFAGSGGVDRTIARLNIEHFRKLLSEEKDDAKRRIIRRLLVEEEAKLASLDKPPGPQDEKN
jgi:hypothetical protein